MKQLLIMLTSAMVFSSTGCVMVDCITVRHIEGVLVDARGRAISGWVGATEREANPEQACHSISDREEWGEPEKSWLGLTHTGEDGRFSLDHGSAITWGYTLLFGFIPLGSTTPPDVPILDHIFLYVHGKDGWRTVPVPLTPEQQTRSKPGERWIDISRIVVQ
ncbi:MAG: hypothetical protein ACYTF6_07435 [Planctomycetota bacterium]|jgi:hypothetical protein